MRESSAEAIVDNALVELDEVIHELEDPLLVARLERVALALCELKRRVVLREGEWRR